MSDHKSEPLAENYKHIWLEPICCVDERHWCQDPQPCDDCGLPSIKYIRADIAASTIERLTAENAELRAERDKWDRRTAYDELKAREYENRATQQGQIDRLTVEKERLAKALTQVVADIEDYERVNNLAPNPGRKYCWDSVAHAHEVLGTALPQHQQAEKSDG